MRHILAVVRPTFHMESRRSRKGLCRDLLDWAGVRTVACCTGPATRFTGSGPIAPDVSELVSCLCHGHGQGALIAGCGGNCGGLK